MSPSPFTEGVVTNILLPLQCCDMCERGRSPGRMSWTPRHRDAGTFLLCTCFHFMLTSREELLILGMFDVGTE